MGLESLEHVREQAPIEIDPSPEQHVFLVAQASYSIAFERVTRLHEPLRFMSLFKQPDQGLQPRADGNYVIGVVCDHPIQCVQRRAQFRLAALVPEEIHCPGIRLLCFRSPNRHKAPRRQVSRKGQDEYGCK